MPLYLNVRVYVCEIGNCLCYGYHISGEWKRDNNNAKKYFPHNQFCSVAAELRCSIEFLLIMAKSSSCIEIGLCHLRNELAVGNCVKHYVS